jgi:hypothetical protein
MFGNKVVAVATREGGTDPVVPSCCLVAIMTNMLFIVGREENESGYEDAIASKDPVQLLVQVRMAY